MCFQKKTQIYSAFIENMIIRSYRKRNSNMVMFFYTKCYCKNLMLLNVILIYT